MKSLYKILLVPAAVVTMQSCFVAKDYEQPEVVEQEYYRTDSIPQDSLNMANVSWRDIFTDPLLQNYIDSALVNNIDIRIALQQIQAAQAYVKQGKAGYLPTLSAGANYTLSYPSKNGQQGAMLAQLGRDHAQIFELSANLSWEADVWGKIRSQKRAFDASYLQTVAAHKAVKTQLIAGIASAYYQLLAIDEQIDVTNQTIATRKKSYETTKALQDAGITGITTVAVEQTKAQYINAQGLLIDLQKQARVLENTICLLMGEAPHSIARTDLDDQHITTKLKVGVPMQLLSNRPDVIAAELNYRQTFEMTNVARANFYPSLTIGATGGIQSLEIENWFNANSLFANILGGLTAPIFNGRKIRTQYEVAQVQQEQARLNFKGTILTASKEVSDALYAYQAATQKIDLKIQERALLQQAVEDSQALLTSGYNNFSYLEVLSAQQNALSSSLQVINARVNQLNSMVTLYQALGGGWR